MTQNDVIDLPKTGFVRERQLLKLIPFSHGTLWAKVKKGEFPAPIKLSARITAWDAESVRAWLDEFKGKRQ